jgi:hypothetical protein
VPGADVTSAGDRPGVSHLGGARVHPEDVTSYRWVVSPSSQNRSPPRAWGPGGLGGPGGRSLRSDRHLLP